MRAVVIDEVDSLLQSNDNQQQEGQRSDLVKLLDHLKLLRPKIKSKSMVLHGGAEVDFDDDDRDIQQCDMSIKPRLLCFVSATARTTHVANAFIAPLLQGYRSAFVSLDGIQHLPIEHDRDCELSGTTSNTTTSTITTMATHSSDPSLGLTLPMLHAGITHCVLMSPDNRGLSMLMSVLKIVPERSCVLVFVSNHHKAEVRHAPVMSDV